MSLESESPSELSPQFKAAVLSATGASQLEIDSVIQELWSGYGRILRLRLKRSPLKTVIAKLISPGDSRDHPRGWNSNLSHQRKLKSYKVESAWYRGWAQACDLTDRVPHLIAFEEHHGQTLLVLEDLDEAGFPKRFASLPPPAFEACLDWLASFHARFLGLKPTGLWERGTYWHLETRSEEWKALDDPPLKEKAEEIDRILSSAKHQTIVHGDAKVANFCFSESGDKVAAVDFQYVGGGCGMKDLTYFVGSCLDESACEQREGDILNRYFQSLRKALQRHHPETNAAEVEAEWRPLYRVAWVDFHRFLKGWSPGHWKINSYSERLVRDVLPTL